MSLCSRVVVFLYGITGPHSGAPCRSLWYHDTIRRFYTVLQKTLHCAVSWHFILPTPMCIEYWKLPICGNDYKLCRDICHHGDGHRGDVYHHVWLTVDWVEINLHTWRTKPNMIICLKSLRGVEAVDRSELVVYASDNLMALDSHVRDKIYFTRGTAAAAPLPFRPGNPALCGNRPLVTPYCCRLGDLLCFVFIVWLLCVWFVCVLFVPSVLWYCWLGLLTYKNRLPYNLYCVGGDVKHCSIQSSLFDTAWPHVRLWSDEASRSPTANMSLAGCFQF